MVNLSTMDPLVFILALTTVAANDVSKVSMIDVSGGVYFQIFFFLCPGRTNFGAVFILGPANIVMSWGFKSFYGIGGL